MVDHTGSAPALQIAQCTGLRLLFLLLYVHSCFLRHERPVTREMR